MLNKILILFFPGDETIVVDLTKEEEFAEIEEITQQIISHCAQNVQNPVEILKYAQEKIMCGRPLETMDTSTEIEGETNFILIDRENILKSGFEEISEITNFR